MSGFNEYLAGIVDGGVDEESAAMAILEKVAEDNGINIDDLTDEEAEALLADALEDSSDETIGDEYEEEGEKMSGYLTHADVAAELAKVASANGVDVGDLGRDEYHALYNDLAEQMSDPAYFQKQAENQEKVAEADYLGRVMAHSFDDELNKIANKQSLIQRLKGWERSTSRNLGARLRGGGKSGDPLRGEKMRAAATAKGSPDRVRAYRLGKADEEYSSRRLGRQVLGGSAAAGGAAGAGGIGYAATREKKSSYDPELDAALEILADRGLLD